MLSASSRCRCVSDGSTASLAGTVRFMQEPPRLRRWGSLRPDRGAGAPPELVSRMSGQYDAARAGKVPAAPCGEAGTRADRTFYHDSSPKSLLRNKALTSRPLV